MEVEMERFDRTIAKQQTSDNGDLRVPEGSERAELTTLGPKYDDVEGMSQMTYHTHSQFGAKKDTQHDGESGRDSRTHSMYTKPFTVQSQKDSEKSKMHQSFNSKPGTEV